MTHFHIACSLPIPPEGYLEDRETESYRNLQVRCVTSPRAAEIRRLSHFPFLQAKRMGHRGNTCIRDEVNDQGLREQVVKVVPNVDVPKLVKKFLTGGEIEIIETRRFQDTASKSLPYVTEFHSWSNVTDKVYASGTITVDRDSSRGENRTMLSLDGKIVAKLPSGVRETVVNMVLKQIRKGYEVLPGIIREWQEQFGKDVPGEDGDMSERMSGSSFWSASSSLPSMDVEEDETALINADNVRCLISVLG